MRIVCIMKYFTLIVFTIIFLCSCVPHKNIRNFIGIDVSLSAKPDADKNMAWLKSKAHSGENMVIFIFADQCYESYAGTRPIKDRDTDDLITKAYTSASGPKWGTGTKFENIVTFLSNRIINQDNHEEIRIFIYTDGYFETSNVAKKDIKTELNQLYKAGLTQITFKGVRIDTKEKIYTWFRDSHIKINFVE